MQHIDIEVSGTLNIYYYYYLIQRSVPVADHPFAGVIFDALIHIYCFWIIISCDYGEVYVIWNHCVSLWRRKSWKNSPKIKHANLITYTPLTDFYIYKRTVSMIFFFNLCHDNDCHSHSNCACPPTHSLTDTNFKTLELVCHNLQTN